MPSTTPLVRPPQPPQPPPVAQTMAATGMQTTAAPSGATPGTQTPLLYRAGIPAAQVSVPRVATELNTLTAANSPYIDQARQRAVRAAASRGMQNSTMAAAAGEEAAIAQALPIAQQDAGYVQEMDRLGYTMSGNMQGRYGEHAQAIQNSASAQIAAIAAAPGMDNATKQALIQGVNAQRDADLAFAGALYEQLPAWDPGWTLLGGAGRAPTAGGGSGGGSGGGGAGAGTGGGGWGSISLPPSPSPGTGTGAGTGAGAGTGSTGVGTGGAAGIGGVVGAAGGLINALRGSGASTPTPTPTPTPAPSSGGGPPAPPPGTSQAAKALADSATSLPLSTASLSGNLAAPALASLSAGAVPGAGTGVLAATGNAAAAPSMATLNSLVGGLPGSGTGTGVLASSANAVPASAASTAPAATSATPAAATSSIGSTIGAAAGAAGIAVIAAGITSALSGQSKQRASSKSGWNQVISKPKTTWTNPKTGKKHTGWVLPHGNAFYADGLAINHPQIGAYNMSTGEQGTYTFKHGWQAPPTAEQRHMADASEGGGMSGNPFVPSSVAPAVAAVAARLPAATTTVAIPAQPSWGEGGDGGANTATTWADLIYEGSGYEA